MPPTKAPCRLSRFSDGNGILYGTNGSKRIADNTLVALTLMIAESRTEEKDTMVKVVVEESKWERNILCGKGFTPSFLGISPGRKG